MQTSADEIVASVVVATAEFPAVRDALDERLRRLTFNEFKIEVMRCERLPITAVGKSRFVVGLHD